MTKIDLASLISDSVAYNLTDLKNRLLPVICQQSLARTLPKLKAWATKIVSELQRGLSSILPLKDNEVAFIQGVRAESKISPELITDSKVLAEKIELHPAIHWVIKRYNGR